MALAILYDFDPATNSVPYGDLREIDRYALHRLAEVAQESLQAYDKYEFHKVSQAVHKFCGQDLSAFYFDVLKDTFYAEAANSHKRRSAQTAVYQITKGLATILAPILSFTCDEVWAKLRVEGEKPISAQLAGFPDFAAYSDNKLAERWATILGFREDAYRSIEIARQAKEIGKPLEAAVVAMVDEKTFASLQPYADDLKEILLVSRVKLQPGESATPTFRGDPRRWCQMLPLLAGEIGRQRRDRTVRALRGGNWIRPLRLVPRHLPETGRQGLRTSKGRFDRDSTLVCI